MTTPIDATTDDETTKKKGEMKNRIERMLGCYRAEKSGFGKNWKKIADTDAEKRFFELAKQARMYCFEEEKEAAEFVFSRRNLVNIGMAKDYDLEKWKAFTGYDASGYDAIYSSTQEFPPMIGAYCVTPVFVSGNDNDNDERHVFSSIGVALDSKQQTDYKILSQINDEERLEMIIVRMRKAYQLFFACLDETKLKKAALCILGSVSFATYFGELCGGKDYTKDVWWKVVQPFVDKRKNDVEFYLLGNQEEFEKTQEKLNFGLTTAGLFPVNEPIRSDEVSSVLFQNAWDPHSVVGNGHFTDNSLDGYVGRATVVAPLTFPGTNVFMARSKTIKFIPFLSDPTTSDDCIVGAGKFHEGASLRHVKLVRYNDAADPIKVNKLITRLETENPHFAGCFLGVELRTVNCDKDQLREYEGLKDVEVKPNDEWKKWIAAFCQLDARPQNCPCRFAFVQSKLKPKNLTGTLHDWWVTREATDKEKQLMIAQILKAREYLSKEGITRDNIHSKNIYVQKCPNDTSINFITQKQTGNAFPSKFLFDLDGNYYDCSYRPVIRGWDTMTTVNSRPSEPDPSNILHADLREVNYASKDVIGTFRIRENATKDAAENRAAMLADGQKRVEKVSMLVKNAIEAAAEAKMKQRQLEDDIQDALLEEIEAELEAAEAAVTVAAEALAAEEKAAKLAIAAAEAEEQAAEAEEQAIEAEEERAADVLTSLKTISMMADTAAAAAATAAAEATAATEAAEAAFKRVKETLVAKNISSLLKLLYIHVVSV
jgi:hypothetical protein